MLQVYEHALRLDGPTLANLELLENSEGGAAGSLLSRLDTCVTPGTPSGHGHLDARARPAVASCHTVTGHGQLSRPSNISKAHPLAQVAFTALRSSTCESHACGQHEHPFCAFTGGRRLLRRWICRPLQDVAAIDCRLDAVDELLVNSQLKVLYDVTAVDHRS